MSSGDDLYANFRGYISLVSSGDDLYVDLRVGIALRSGCIIAWENIVALTEGFRVDENDHSHNARVDVWLA